MRFAQCSWSELAQPGILTRLYSHGKWRAPLASEVDEHCDFGPHLRASPSIPLQGSLGVEGWCISVLILIQHAFVYRFLKRRGMLRCH
jgi:hypothetical protein